MQKRDVNHSDGRGLEQLLEPWRCVRAGGAGVFWNRGDAARSLEPRKFRNRPQGTRRSGGVFYMAMAHLLTSPKANLRARARKSLGPGLKSSKSRRQGIFLDDFLWDFFQIVWGIFFRGQNRQIRPFFLKTFEKTFFQILENLGGSVPGYPSGPRNFGKRPHKHLGQLRDAAKIGKRASEPS